MIPADRIKPGLRALLADGPRKEIGAAAVVAGEILDTPQLVESVIALLTDDDPAVVAHAAHALMQVSLDEPTIFQTQIEVLLDVLEFGKQWEIGEQLPKILTRCDLTPAQAERCAGALEKNLQDKSNIAAASALSGLARLAEQQLIDDKVIQSAFETALNSPRKALAARARRLLAGK